MTHHCPIDVHFYTYIFYVRYVMYTIPTLVVMEEWIMLAPVYSQDYIGRGDWIVEFEKELVA